MENASPPAPVDNRRGLIAREWSKEKARTMRTAMGLPADPRLEPRR
jgi:hypothetical protein